MRAIVLFGLAALFALPALAAPEVKGKVYFPHDQTKLSEAASGVVGMLVDTIKRSGADSVVLTGYCDMSEKAPTLLSRYRAKAVADELRRLGLPETIEITWAGKGAVDFDAPTGPDVREPLNRRVTVAY